MADAKNVSKIKVYLKAETVDELIKKQIQNNLINDKMYTYGDPQELKDGGFIVWFLADITDYKEVN